MQLPLYRRTLLINNTSTNQQSIEENCNYGGSSTFTTPSATSFYERNGNITSEGLLNVSVAVCVCLRSLLYIQIARRVTNFLIELSL
jgi:hypothetical protein